MRKAALALASCLTAALLASPGDAKYFANLFPQQPQPASASFFDGLSQILLALAQAERSGGAPSREALDVALNDLNATVTGFRALAETAEETPLPMNRLVPNEQARFAGAAQFLDVQSPKTRRALLTATATCADRVAAAARQFRDDPSLSNYLRLRGVMSAAMDFGAMASVLLSLA